MRVPFILNRYVDVVHLLAIAQLAEFNSPSDIATIIPFKNVDWDPLFGGDEHGADRLLYVLLQLLPVRHYETMHCALCRTKANQDCPVDFS